MAAVQTLSRTPDGRQRRTVARAGLGYQSGELENSSAG
jgi:hypothetical protein